MATFAYTVRDSAGQTRTGTSEAESEEILRRRLQEQGFTVADIKKTGAAKKKAAGGPFTGHAVTVDKAAKTVKLSGKTGRVIQITATTKITKDGKPATLDDLKEGDEVSGGFKTTADGKLEATSLTIGPKVGGKGKDKKDEKKDEKKK